MMTKLPLILAGGALLAGTVAIAQPMGDRGERGPMTRNAVIERTTEAFDKMDVNQDGVLSEADRDARLRQHFAEADTDGDGVLSEAEFTAAHEQMRAKRHERRQARAERRGGGQMMRRGGRGGHGGPGAMLRRADANGDGQVTRDEAQTAALARFDRADSDGDGTVTRDERRAAMQAMRASRRGQ